MATNSVDHFFENWHERYAGLMSFPLYLMYREFSTYYSYIPNGVDTCYHFIPEYTPHYDKILPVCRGVESALKQLYSEISKELDDNCKPFEYISYFSYDKLKNLSSSDNFQKLYETLEDIKSVNDLPNECHFTNFKIDEEVFNKKRKIFFHAEILYWIKKKSIFTNSFLEEYNKYFNDCIKDYNDVIDNDYCEYVEYYEPVLDKFSNNFEETKISLKGTELKISAQDIKLKPKPSCAAKNMSDIPGESERFPEQGDLQSVTIDEQYSSDILPVQIPHNEKGKTIGILLGILFGIFLLFIFVYKFTPFGLWLYHKIKTHERINLEDENGDFVFNTCENENLNSYKEIYNVTYQSA
ncbi:PIR Superfamily Protein [Plasmodium ovale wallikeri]|uniref:PIR Superfamily Protein n=2 Tax=Plasmodium ovale TaxID=36330 RepID=A0A1A9AQ75_PLAOA|nr:PIR Superfamily Protein [Plasmodium ovale wallikeri]SBT58841.1 PIR Superfamily Protein [Plasmodium ovale wallikeri]SBT73729.1 PIR protein [Plasmodium ovale]